MGTSTCMRKAGCWHALHMFMESFQGQYKNGTNGTRDFRMVSASFLILQDINRGPIFASTQDDVCPSLKLKCALFVCATGFCAIAKPYKFNIRDILILVLVAVTSPIYCLIQHSYNF